MNTRWHHGHGSITHSFIQNIPTMQMVSSIVLTMVPETARLTTINKTVFYCFLLKLSACIYKESYASMMQVQHFEFEWPCLKTTQIDFNNGGETFIWPAPVDTFGSSLSLFLPLFLSLTWGISSEINIHTDHSAPPLSVTEGRSASLLVARQAPSHHSCQGNACMQMQLERWRTALGVGGYTTGLVGGGARQVQGHCSKHGLMAVVMRMVCVVNGCTCVGWDKAGGWDVREKVDLGGCVSDVKQRGCTVTAQDMVVGRTTGFVE